MSTIHLQYRGTTAEIQLRGAQIASFKGADGREVIWQADPNVWAQHAPVLFPICGAVKDDKIRIGGVSYPMKKHGFSRAPVYEVCRQGEDFVDLVLRSNEETRACYPFDFAFHVIYTLAENSFTTKLLVENLSDKTMPFCVGGHPGFACPMEDGAAFEDYQLVFPQVEDGEIALCPGGYLIEGRDHLPTFRNAQTLPLKHAYFDERDALIFTNLKSRSVELVHRTSGKGLRFDFPKLDVLAVWSKPGANANYVCLEPWQGMPGQTCDSGDFEDKPFVTLLAPDKSYATWYTATLIC